MSELKAILRRILELLGYHITRVEPKTPISLSCYLQKVRSITRQELCAVCFDNETSIQSELLGAFPVEKAFFSCHLFNSDSGVLVTGSAPTVAIARFIAVVDVEMLNIEAALETFPWLLQAEVLLLSARLGAFWVERFDVPSLGIPLEKHGLFLADVISSLPFSTLQAPAGRVILAYERNAYAINGLYSTGAKYRVNEAVAYLSSPVIRREDFQLLAGRGSFGFAAGVHNPGAIIADGYTYLLPRADRSPWALQKADESLFFGSSQPLLLTLKDDNQVASAVQLSTVDPPNPQATRTGDFRLFKFHNRLFTNHFVMTSPRPALPRRPLRVEELQTRVGVSELDIEKRQLVWYGFPTLDRPLARAEKNWAMFTKGNQLFLLYSFAPYVLLAANNWPGLAFSTVVNRSFASPYGGDSLPLRNSINPVDYDDTHWLHIVHKVYPSKQYAFWAVLIDKQTLLPVKTTLRPLARGWQSYPASVIYLCSAIAGPKDIFLFSGLDDNATAVAKVSRLRLDAEWIPIDT